MICSQLAQAGIRVSDEHRTILSAYSSAAEYHVNTDRRIDIDGSFMIGYFELLDLELDVVTSVQTAIAQIVSLPAED
jgi:hypothetical protein